MTYDNPLRPSGDEVFDVGSVVAFKTENRPAYEYLGVYRTGKHVMRGLEDGYLYETLSGGIQQYRLHVDIPEIRSRWTRKKHGVDTVTIVGVVDFDDGGGVQVGYVYDGEDGDARRRRYLRNIVEFTEAYKPVDN